MDLLLILHNISIIQSSVFKCVCRQARDYVVMTIPDKSHSLLLRLHSYDLFCYFNISPHVFHDKVLRLKLEDDIIASDDVEFLHKMYDLGWKYNFETMHRAVENRISLKMMKALRDHGCHWGTKTLKALICSCSASMPDSCPQHDQCKPHDLLQFAIEDGYPLTSDNLRLAVMTGDSFAVKQVVNAYLQSAQPVDAKMISMLFAARIFHDANNYNENIKANMQDIIDFHDELKSIGVCAEP